MATYRPSSDVVSTQLDDEEAVLLSLETQQYYSLNETGSRVWELLSDGHDVDAIATAISDEWEVTEDEARSYVQSFLDELAEEGLVEETNAAQ
jgi:hypothetical protein